MSDDYDRELADKVYTALQEIKSYRDDRVIVYEAEGGRLCVEIGPVPVDKDKYGLVLVFRAAAEFPPAGMDNIYRFRPGKWVDYLFNVVLPKVRAEREAERQQWFAPVDDTKLFGDKS